MPVVPCVRPSQGSVTKPANGMKRSRRSVSAAAAHEQADFPVAGVIAERERRAVRLAHAALRAEDQRLGPLQLGRLPAHADVLRPPEDVAARALQQIGRLERQRARRSGLGGDDVVERWIAGIEQIGPGHSP